MLTIEEKILAVVTALEDIKANDVTVLDTSKKSPLFERMVIASANSPRQTRALAGNVTGYYAGNRRIIEFRHCKRIYWI